MATDHQGLYLHLEHVFITLPIHTQITESHVKAGPWLYS